MTGPLHMLCMQYCGICYGNHATVPLLGLAALEDCRPNYSKGVQVLLPRW